MVINTPKKHGSYTFTIVTPWLIFINDTSANGTDPFKALSSQQLCFHVWLRMSQEPREP